MSDLCLDEGTLQSYYDGQISSDEIDRVATHLTSCSVCTEALRTVESEMALATGAFAAEMALSVPTEHLRSRLDNAIAQLEAPRLANERNASSGIRAWLVSFSSAFDLSPQRSFGLASIVVFFVLATVVGGIVMTQRDPQAGLEIVAGNKNGVREVAVTSPTPTETLPSGEKQVGRIESRGSASRLSRSRRAMPAGKNNMETAHAQLPGERNYLQAISLLTEAIEVNGESSLKPTLLSDYKRNLEVVNEAIKATQKTARTNPQSTDAAEMLFAVYQSKLDLLSAVAEQSQPMIAQR